MSSQDLHEFVFLWPSAAPGTVTVAGTFEQQQWSESQALKLTKTATGFEGRIRIPWDTKIKYKFIVDGEWLVREDQPAEMDPGGYLNNVYFSPKPPPPAVQENGVKEESGEAAINGTADGGSTLSAGPVVVPHVVKTNEGDALPPPIELDAERNSGANSDVVHDLTGNPGTDISKPVSGETTPQSPFASGVPIMIVPVNAPENNTLPSSSSDKIPELTSPALTPALATGQVSPAADLSASPPTLHEEVKVEVPSEISTHEPVVPAAAEDTSPATGELGSTLVETEPAESQPVVSGSLVGGENGIDHATPSEPTESALETKTPVDVENTPEEQVLIPETMATEAVANRSHAETSKEQEQSSQPALGHPEESESVTTPLTASQPVEPATNGTTADSSVKKGSSDSNSSSSSAVPAKDPKDEPSTPVASTPSTPVKSRHHFPRRASESPSSSKMDSTSSRKKKTSFFGKIVKKIFHHEDVNDKA